MRFAFPFLPILIAVLALIGWQFDIGFLKRAYGATAMNPVSACCLTLIGLEAARLVGHSKDSRFHLAGTLSVLAVLIIGALRLVEIAAHLSIGIDTFLFSEKLAHETLPNHMAPNSALCFFCLAISLLLIRIKSARSVIAAQIITGIPLSIALVGLLGYIYDIKGFYTVGIFIPMALNTSVTLILLALSIWVTVPEEGLAKVVINNGPAGRTAQLLLPACVLVPVFIGWLRIMAVRAKLFDSEVGVAMSVSASAITLMLVTFVTVSKLHTVDLRRTQAETHLNEFYAVLAHELRNPLTSIRGSISLLVAGVISGASEKGRQLLAIAQSETDRMLRLINDLLDLEKIERGQWQLNVTEAQPEVIITNSLNGLKGLASLSNITLKSEVHCNAPILCDSDRLQQVLTNLVANAIRFSPKDGEVCIAVNRIASGIRISVTDKGPGIAAADAQKLFRKFEQLSLTPKEQGATGGTGLGLSIAKAIVELHGGQIGINSELGHGATFWLLCRNSTDKKATLTKG